MKYLLKEGTGPHFDAQTRQILRGPCTVTSIKPLDQIFPEKFEKAEEFVSNIAPSEPPSEKASESSEDVSDQFDYSVEETGLVVLQTAKNRFDVCEADDFSSPLNDEPLTKSKVLPFIKAACTEE
jgi:hypothetical protein